MDKKIKIELNDHRQHHAIFCALSMHRNMFNGEIGLALFPVSQAFSHKEDDETKSLVNKITEALNPGYELRSSKRFLIIKELLAAMDKYPFSLVHNKGALEMSFECAQALVSMLDAYSRQVCGQIQYSFEYMTDELIRINHKFDKRKFYDMCEDLKTHICGLAHGYYLGISSKDLAMESKVSYDLMNRIKKVISDKPEWVDAEMTFSDAIPAVVSIIE
jgi:hypothetical protein